MQIEAGALQKQLATNIYVIHIIYIYMYIYI